MSEADFRPPERVLVTGARGNLGCKAVEALLATDWCREIIALDLADTASDAATDARVTAVSADLANPGDARWRGAVEEADAVVHLAARNPMPDATWSEAAASFDMTANLAIAAVEARVRRFVFASSNHVMGGYKDTDLAAIPASLTHDTPPFPGTKWRSGQVWLDPTAYATAKLMGERACASAAGMSQGRLSSVCLRIGWCQPSENTPETLSAAGVPARERADTEGDERDERWFRNMWLSNRDFASLVLCALSAPPSGWPAPTVVVNGMSRNNGMPWALTAGRDWIGYSPQDDVGAWAAA